MSADLIARIRALETLSIFENRRSNWSNRSPYSVFRSYTLSVRVAAPAKGRPSVV